MLSLAGAAMTRIVFAAVASSLLLLSLGIFPTSAPAKVAMAEDAQGPNAEVPELNVLKVYAGKFKIEVLEPALFSGSAEGEWVLDGRFVKQSFKLENDQSKQLLTGTHLFTYDIHKKAYRCWRYYSNGFIYEAQGAWDEKEKTMTWTGPDADSPGTMRMASTFDKEGNQTWKLTKEDPNGRVQGGEVKGKHILIK